MVDRQPGNYHLINIYTSSIQGPGIRPQAFLGRLLTLGQGLEFLGEKAVLGTFLATPAQAGKPIDIADFKARSKTAFPGRSGRPGRVSRLAVWRRGQ